MSALILAFLPKIHSVFEQEEKLLEVGRTRPDMSHFLWGRNMASLLAEKQLVWKCGRLWTPNPREEHTVSGTDRNALLSSGSLPSHFISDRRSYDKEWKKQIG